MSEAQEIQRCVGICALVLLAWGAVILCTLDSTLKRIEAKLDTMLKYRDGERE